MAELNEFADFLRSIPEYIGDRLPKGLNEEIANKLAQFSKIDDSNAYILDTDKQEISLAAARLKNAVRRLRRTRQYLRRGSRRRLHPSRLPRARIWGTKSLTMALQKMITTVTPVICICKNDHSSQPPCGGVCFCGEEIGRKKVGV